MIVASRQVKAFFTFYWGPRRKEGGEMSKWRKSLAILFAVLVAGAFSASTASAGKFHQCNAGGGNGQESTVENDCDPGNSGGNNNGGG
jgi:hypothetical protein